MTTKKWEDYSAAELQNFRATLDIEKLPPDQKAQIPALDNLIVRKVAEEAVASGSAAERQKELFKKLDARAHRLFPELTNKESEFSKKVDEYLESLGTAKTDPSALLTAATLAADDLGIDPVTTRNTKDPSKTGASADGKPALSDAPDKDAFFKRTSKLAHLLEGEGLLDLSKDGVKDRLVAKHTESLGEEI